MSDNSEISHSRINNRIISSNYWNMDFLDKIRLIYHCLKIKRKEIKKIH